MANMHPPSVYAAHAKLLKAEITDTESKVLFLYLSLIETEKLESEAAKAIARAPTFHRRPEGTMLTWTSNKNPDTYRVSIVMKKWKITQMRSVTDGYAEGHYDGCDCAACLLYAQGMSSKPMKVTFFDDEYAWRKTLDMENGTITVTPPPISDTLLKRLSSEALKGTTDEEKLKELDERFPGGAFVLTTMYGKYTIIYKENPVYGNIHCEDAHITAPRFDHFGASDKPWLMVEWRGHSIDLSHLF